MTRLHPDLIKIFQKKSLIYVWQNYVKFFPNIVTACYFDKQQFGKLSFGINFFSKLNGPIFQNLSRTLQDFMYLTW